MKILEFFQVLIFFTIIHNYIFDNYLSLGLPIGIRYESGATLNME
jgi:hypothetical protein